MKVDFNAQSQKSNPQFGRINLYGGAEEVVKRVIKKEKDIEDFAVLVIDHRDIDSVDVNFFAKGKNTLSAKVAKMLPDYGCKEFSQRLFESPMHFIKRCCSYGSELAENLKNKSIDIKDVIDLTR
ncbi:MAG: hypothetical protein NC191_08760 [Muribaculaceae bacterium]|nr:hypothetical protein [Muribaculaceae bacterium]